MIITTVTPIKIFETDDGLSRDLYRVDLQLNSLMSQKTDAKIVPIISDMSDSKWINDQIEDICNKYNAVHIVTHSDLIWNKALCLNIGIVNSSQKSKYIATLDMDMVYSDLVFQKCVDLLENDSSDSGVVLSRTFSLNEEKIDRDFSHSHFQSLRDNGTFLNLSGNGGIQFFRREWLFKARGYDERFSLWGGIDNEIVKRVLYDGGKEYWISKDESEIYLIHLSHKKFLIPGVSRKFISNYKKQNNVPIYKNDRSVIRNKKSWGNHIEAEGPTWNDLHNC
jgi:hypothetical protein